jgi:hypothetical protein
MPRPKSNKTCSICDIKHYAKGWCRKHYVRNLTHGDPNIKLIADKGAGKPYKTSNGYLVIPNHSDHPNARKDGQILEHVLVMSKHLGRPLLANENVHHKNGDRLDNRIENLELWSRSQPSGQRVEDKIEWAIEILKTYRPALLA